MLHIRHLSKRFGTNDVLRDVSLSLRSGSVTAVVGPNGAGKSTLIKSVLGLAHADAGEILLGASPVDDVASRARIGYMPQIARFPDNLSARDVIALLVGLRRSTPPEGLDLELMAAFGLEPHLDKPLRALSGGTRQKVNALLAFLFRPELLVLDEPTAGLDPVASGILKDKIKAERGHGRTVLVTSHVSSELDELADDVVFLLDGRVLFAGSVAALLARTGQVRLERAIARTMTDPACLGAAA